MATMTEAQFEERLVGYLGGKIPVDSMIAKETTNPYFLNHSKQLWKYEPSIKTTEALWDNFKRIIEQRNPSAAPLTDTEFGQVQRVICELYTPYKAGQFLYGHNGVSEIDITKDDGRHVFLNIFNQREVGAGSTVYQIVTQIQRKAKIMGKQDRRFDTTLLINGLPIIQIEEKADTHDVNEALRQMEEYIHENQYSDIFSTVQILVAMTPNDVKYMANTTPEGFNSDFSFRWQTRNGDPVREWKHFADHFLSIPMAHNMATNYMILEGTTNKQMLKVMRPYQVYATEAVIDQLKRTDFDVPGPHKVGYVWHTTGSGKTITSFKTAWLASRLPKVEKVVFIVDRIALTRQTLENYCAYDPEGGDGLGETGNIEDTKHTRDLVKQLKSKANNIVVTSVQKLANLAEEWDKKGNPIADKHIVFIVDEAHRSTGGKSFETIQKVFKQCAWVGYTGTPMFETVVGKNNSDTQDIFGRPLHQYTIREAIADHNVLGFKVDFETTISEQQMKEEYLPSFYRAKHPTWTDEDIQEKINNLTPEDMDDMVEPSVYDENMDHIRVVVEDIFKHWRNRSNNGKYNAMLTTNVGGTSSSIPMAIMYFDEFQRVNKERAKEGKFTLKVGITFSHSTDNKKEQVVKNDGLSRAINHHNELFGTSFTMADVPAYTEDVATRLARRSGDGNYYDLVIVVDQLLTGFDAPEMNTLYVDRTLKYASLIQAYSRTNRIANMQEKPWGRIINYRWPTYNEKLMNEALSIYANKDSSWKAEQTEIPETGKKEDDGEGGNGLDGVLAKKFKEQLAEVQQTVDRLKEFTEDVTRIPSSEAAQEEMLSLLQTFSRGMAKLKQYDVEIINDTVEGFDYDKPEVLVDMLGLTLDQERMLTVSLFNEVKEAVAQRKGISIVQLEFAMTHVKDVKVNYDYLTELVEALLNQVHNNEMNEAAETRDKIKAFTLGMEDRKNAEKINDTADQIYNGQYPPKDSNMTYPVKLDNVAEIIEGATEDSIRRKISQFRVRMGIYDIVTLEELREMIENHTYGSISDLNERNQLSEIQRKSKTEYKDKATDEDIQKLSWIKYRNTLSDELYKLADDIVGC